MTDHEGHAPVLLEEAVAALRPRDGGTYVDGTFGGGGHSARLAKEIGSGGRILAFDRDSEAANRAAALDASCEATVTFIHDSFSDMFVRANAMGVDRVDGILLDLGISSLQLDETDRGFSFLREGPLDMRMDRSEGESAADLINRISEDDLVEVLFTYGEERRARAIARAICRARSRHEINTTTELAEIVESAIGRDPRSRIHPATRTFQALRIAVNDELSELEEGLDAALKILAPGGRLVVISFHSLEDRIVKHFIAREARGCICPPEQPVCTCGRSPSLKAVGRYQRASDAEVERNPRARSAIMRVAERLS